MQRANIDIVIKDLRHEPEQNFITKQVFLHPKIHRNTKLPHNDCMTLKEEE